MKVHTRKIIIYPLNIYIDCGGLTVSRHYIGAAKIAKRKIVLGWNVSIISINNLILRVPGLHGGHRLRQVHQADQQGGNHPLQHQRPHHPQVSNDNDVDDDNDNVDNAHAQERVILPLLQNRRHEVSNSSDLLSSDNFIHESTLDKK